MNLLQSLEETDPILAGDALDMGMTGSGLYSLLTAKLGSKEAASNYLRKLGIPGLKYFDAGSRTAKEGTRNIVLFDDSLAKIISRK